MIYSIVGMYLLAVVVLMELVEAEVDEEGKPIENANATKVALIWPIIALQIILDKITTFGNKNNG